ncbi:MAG: hypothetical protein ACRDHL_10770, partial [Candidatus Promineifilaceae bacterium]
MQVAGQPLLSLKAAFSAPAARQSGLLFGLDTLANLVDYGFHLYLGRALFPADFALVQTLNAVLLIVMATAAMLQPVVARFVGEERAAAEGQAETQAVFQAFFRLGAALGLALTVAVWLLRTPIGRLLNVPPAAVALSSGMLLLALLRPVVSGVLQGQERFVAYGLLRLGAAVARLAAAVALLSLGGGALAAVAALPLGSAAALLASLA